MRWDSEVDREPTGFELARRETIRYHEELYASAALGQAGTWLAEPHRLMADALQLVPAGRPAVAYDLGAGIGRHTIPLLRKLPGGSDVYAVDLLPSALRSLENAVPPGTQTHLHTRPADLDSFEFETPADLIALRSTTTGAGARRCSRVPCPPRRLPHCSPARSPAST